VPNGLTSRTRAASAPTASVGKKSAREAEIGVRLADPADGDGDVVVAGQRPFDQRG
jgi:hypothetical protein